MYSEQEFDLIESDLEIAENRIYKLEDRLRIVEEILFNKLGYQVVYQITYKNDYSIISDSFESHTDAFNFMSKNKTLQNEWHKKCEFYKTDPDINNWFIRECIIKRI
jgi:hypothetical protein